MEFPQKIRNRTAVCLVAQLCLTLYDPMDCNPPGSSVHGDSPGKNTGVGSHALLHGIFPIQESNPGLLHCEQILYCLSPPELPSVQFNRSVVSDSLRPHGLYPARLLCPWGLSRQEYWSGLPCRPPGGLPNPRIKPRSPTLQVDSLSSEPPGKPKCRIEFKFHHLKMTYFSFIP